MDFSATDSHGKADELKNKFLFIDARNYHTVADRTLNEWSKWQLKNMNAIVWFPFHGI